MKDFLERNKDLGILVLRLGVGLTFLLVHGLPKIQGGPDMWAKIGGAMGNVGISFAPEFWGFMAAASEFGGGLLLLLGLFTRPASAFMAFTMLMATFQHLHKLDPWGTVSNPLRLFTVFVALVFLGAGKYSLDAWLARRKKK